MRVGKIVVVGGTGMVGRELLKVMNHHGLEPKELVITGARTVGTKVETPYGELSVVALDQKVFSDAEFVFFAAGASVSKEWIPNLRGRSFRIIDLSSAFRYMPDVPLVIPSINGDDIGEADLIACPNCTTSIAVMPLAPIHNAYGITRVGLVSYQAASGAGKDALEALENQIRVWVETGSPPLEGRTASTPLTLAGNAIPRIDVLERAWGGFTREEMKTHWEANRMLFARKGGRTVCVNSTCVRIPVRRCHSEVLTIELASNASLPTLRAILQDAFGVFLMDDASEWYLPTPLNMEGKEEVGVGRIRLSPDKNGKEVLLWVCGDQLLRGAALTAVEILEYLKGKKF